jgi:hypothetical protein
LLTSVPYLTNQDIKLKEEKTIIISKKRIKKPKVFAAKPKTKIFTKKEKDKGILKKTKNNSK